MLIAAGAFGILVLCIGLYIFATTTAPSRWWMVGLVLPILYISGWIIFTETLSRPKPTQAEILRLTTDEAEIIAFRLIEDRGIYLWLNLSGISEPRYYILPWDDVTARALNKLSKSNVARGGMIVKGLFQRSWNEGPPTFYPLPQSKLPDKMGRELPPEARPLGREM